MEDFEEWEEGADPSKNLCVECGEGASGRCDFCEDCLCVVCFLVLHRKGKRRNHNHLPFSSSSSMTSLEYSSSLELSSESSLELESSSSLFSSSNHQNEIPRQLKEKSPAWFVERAKFIPIRLTLKERKMLRLLEAALQILRYTDIVDVPTFKNEAMRKGKALQEIVATLAGLATSWKYSDGQSIVSERNFQKFEGFYRDLFEIGRRYKVMNPEKMRSEYGKLAYLLQDCTSPEIQEQLGFSCSKPLVTVYSYLKQKGVAHLLEDPYVGVATMEIESRGRQRSNIQMDIREKERKRDFIAKKDISSEDIKWCLYSIGDNHTYLHFNRDPVDRMIGYLQKYFSLGHFKKGYSLAISVGFEGVRLTHTHNKQYHYVIQSLNLWREIAHDMFKLWVLAEQDLLDPKNPYTLSDTGQGLQRVQNAPKILKNVQKILVETQKKVGSWVGSSVIHLGDKNVPNALMFIDKYTQVQRILNPIVLTLDQIDKWRDNSTMKSLINGTFGGPEKLKKDILVDFFRFGFDGSGADNFYDAGSCIDGRLTSAWNWCNKLNEKPFYHIFRLAGFAGFDGDFQT